MSFSKVSGIFGERICRSEMSVLANLPGPESPAEITVAVIDRPES